MQTLVNFRDIGNFETIDGRKVKKGHFYRSAEVVKVSPADAAQLTNKYDVKRIFDFRSEKEVAERPDDQLTGVVYHHINVMKSAKGRTASLEDLETHAAHPDEAMLKIYEQLILSSGAQEGYQQFLTSILTDESPLLFHCFAGKDRTGIGAAFILKALNVPDEAIYKDYLQTNIQRKTENDQIIQAYRKQHKVNQQEIERLATMLYVKAEYLNYAFSLIQEHFQTFENYLTEALKLPKSFSTDIKKLYTE